jgi:PAS domain S-box-containing protein
VKRKALVVDNHPVMLKFMSSLLQKEGYQVRTAEDGISALDILQIYLPDIIFLDLIMPNISGDKLCLIIRRMPALENVGIIILSSIAAEEKVDFVGLGANACIAKGPFNKMAEHVLSALNDMDQGRSGDLTKEIRGLEDICERQATKELIASKKHSEVVFNNMSEGILELNANAKIVYANPAALSLINITEEDILGADVIEFFQGSHRQRVENLLEMNEGVARTITEKCPLELSDKKISMEVIPIKENKNRFSIVILNDVTERIRLENHLWHAQKMEAIGTLAGGIAHQFNNALFALSGNTELLQMEVSEDENIKNYLRSVQGPMNRMTGLTDQLLAYAQEGKYQSKIVSIRELVKDTLGLIQHTLDPLIRIETDLQDEPLNVEADIAQMQMAFSAILANATEAVEGKGRIRISGRNGIQPEPGPGQYICLRIEDDGKGMDYDIKSRIFEPFFTTKFQGRGLGMAAVYGIVKQHAGYLDIESEVDHGTIVSIYLPAIEKQEQETMKYSRKMLEGNGTILMVDDEEMVLKVGAELVKQMGYDVLEARSGKEAIEVYKENKCKVDMVVLDMIMPDMDGGRAYEQMKEINPDVKVILTSGYGIGGQVTEIMRRGCDSFIQKPFGIKELYGKIEEIMRRE